MNNAKIANAQLESQENDNILVNINRLYAKQYDIIRKILGSDEETMGSEIAILKKIDNVLRKNSNEKQMFVHMSEEDAKECFKDEYEKPSLSNSFIKEKKCLTPERLSRSSNTHRTQGVDPCAQPSANGPFAEKKEHAAVGKHPVPDPGKKQ